MFVLQTPWRLQLSPRGMTTCYLMLQNALMLALCKPHPHRQGGLDKAGDTHVRKIPSGLRILGALSNPQSHPFFVSSTAWGWGGGGG